MLPTGGLFLNPAAETFQALIDALAAVAPVQIGRAAGVIDPATPLPVITLQPAQDAPTEKTPTQRFRQQWTRTVHIEVFFEATERWHEPADAFLYALRRALVRIKGAVVRIEAVGFSPPNQGGESATVQIRGSFDYTLQFTE